MANQTSQIKNQISKIYFRTFGCKANQYDTELLRARLQSSGGLPVNEPAEADLCVVNSCSVTAMADKECRQFVRHLLRKNKKARIVVTGCYASHAAQELQRLSSRVEVYSNNEKDKLPACVGFEIKPDVFGLTRFSTRARAFVKIQDGCQAPCRYCIIPKVRRTFWNKPVEHACQEIESLVKEGHGEIVLTGIRLGLYQGTSLSGRGQVNLTGLLRKIIELPGHFRVRLSSLEITEVSARLVELMAASDKICRHLHIPLQSADDTVLQEMGRWYSFSDYAKKICLVQEKLPDCAVTTDVLVGFPTETEQSFQLTYERVQKLALSRLHVFPFSRRPGTQAAMLPILPASVVKERTQKLRGLSSKLHHQFCQRFQGQKRDVLAEPSGEGWTDNYIRVPLPDKKVPPGVLVSVTL